MTPFEVFILYQSPLFDTIETVSPFIAFATMDEVVLAWDLMFRAEAVTVPFEVVPDDVEDVGVDDPEDVVVDDDAV